MSFPTIQVTSVHHKSLFLDIRGYNQKAIFNHLSVSQFSNAQDSFRIILRFSIRVSSFMVSKVALKSSTEVLQKELIRSREKARGNFLEI